MDCRFGRLRKVVVACDDRDRIGSRETAHARDGGRGSWEGRECASDDGDARNGGEDTGEHGGRERIANNFVTQ